MMKTTDTKQSPQVALVEYSPECYFKDPLTGTPGWSIAHPVVMATSKAEAAAVIREMPYFDCFIEFDWHHFNDYPKEEQVHTSFSTLSFTIKHKWQTGPTHAEIIKALQETVEILKTDVKETYLKVKPA